MIGGATFICTRSPGKTHWPFKMKDETLEEKLEYWRKKWKTASPRGKKLIEGMVKKIKDIYELHKTIESAKGIFKNDKKD